MVTAWCATLAACLKPPPPPSPVFTSRESLLKRCDNLTGQKTSNLRLWNLKFVVFVECVASSEDEDDEVISPSEDLSKPFGEDENKSEGGEDEELVGRYFESLGTSSPTQKVDEQPAEPPPLDTEKLMRTRLSISARFLSRSHQPGRYANM